MQWLEQPRDDRGLAVFSDAGTWERVSYREVAGRAFAIAGLLLEHGAGVGQRIGVVTAAPDDFFPAFFATHLVGATIVPLPPPMPLQSREAYCEQIAPILRHCRPHILLASRPAAARLAGTGTSRDIGRLVILSRELPHGASIRPHKAPGLSLIQYTSGSTSAPRGVRVLRGQLVAQLRIIDAWLRIDSQHDRGAFWVPHYHDMGLISVLAGIARQGDIMLMRPDQFVRHPLAWLACFGQHGCTVTAAPNLGYRLALRRAHGRRLKLDLSGWHTAIIGSEPIDAGLLAEFVRVFSNYGFRAEAFRPAYGLAEGVLAATGTPRDLAPAAIKVNPESLEFGTRPTILTSRRLDGDAGAELDAPSWLVSVGPPLPGVSIEVRDEDGSLLPEGTVGEIWLRSPSRAEGYFRQRSTHRFTKEGLRTGDVGFVVAGELYVVGRVADRIKVRGRYLYAEHLEERIARRLKLRLDGLLAVPQLAGTSAGVVVLWEVHGPPEQRETQIARIRRTTEDLVGHGIEVRVIPVPPRGIPRTTSGKPRRFLAWRKLRTGCDRSGQLDGGVIEGEHIWPVGTSR